MTAAVARLLGEHHCFENRNGGYYRTVWTCTCGADVMCGDHDEDPDFPQAWGAHLAGVVAPLLERAAAEAAADAERFVAAMKTEVEERRRSEQAQFDRADTAAAEVARLRERLNALRVEWYARRDARWNHGTEAGAIEERDR